MIAAALIAAFFSWQTPAAAARAAVDDLLSVDRAFATASAQATDVIAGLSPMFADDVAMPIPGNRFTATRAEAIAAMRTNPDNLTARAAWSPIRGGVSSDGQHGFTFGYMTLRKPDGAELLSKYLAYWIKKPEGWRVAVYRRRARAAGPVSLDMMPPAAPSGGSRGAADAVQLEAARASLDQAERAFSNEAQKIGLAAAFTKYGSADAVNMGPQDAAGFIVGAAAIGKSVGAGTPTDSSPVSWAPDRVIVASSGDFGVTLGMIRDNQGTAPPVPFFTIWRRDGRDGVWRYIAE